MKTLFLAEAVVNQGNVKFASHMSEIQQFMQEKLSEQHWKILNRGTPMIDLIFARYQNNRFFTSLSPERVLELVEKCIDAHSFLLDSNLEPLKIKYIFLGAITEVVSLNAGAYFLVWHSWYNRRWREKDQFFYFRDETIEHKRTNQITVPRWIGSKREARGGITCAKTWRYWRVFRFTFKKIRSSIEQRYPLIPDTVWFSKDMFSSLRDGAKRGNKYFFGKQLSVAFSYPLFLLHLRRKISIPKFEKEFLSKHRWCLERMSRCNPIFLNKYRGEVYREVSLDLGLDPDPSYWRWHFFQNNPISPARNLKFLEKISEIIVGCFADSELEILKEIDVSKQNWNFSSQIKDRYYSRYPSLTPFKEVERNIKEKIAMYRPLLKPETKEVVREILLDEIESVAFVSKTTHLWNLEMMKNLKMGKIKAKRKVTWAVKVILSMLPEETNELLSVEISGRKYSLKERLLARWSDAWFGSVRKIFTNYLESMHIHTPHSMRALKLKEKISETELQAFLGEVDMFFLYPSRGRIIKKIFRRLDTGKSLGLPGMIRTNMSCDWNCDPTSALTATLSLILIAIILTLFFIL